MTGIAYAEDFVTYDPGTGAYQGCRSYGDTNVPLSDPNNLASVRSGYVYANPLPHVLILTAIVVSVATTAVALSLVIRMYQEYGTIEESEIIEKSSDKGMTWT